jgi:hypothetical protein
MKRTVVVSVTPDEKKGRPISTARLGKPGEALRPDLPSGTNVSSPRESNLPRCSMNAGGEGMDFAGLKKVWRGKQRAVWVGV